jgi:undecaprenyl diphosphate synthase
VAVPNHVGIIPDGNRRWAKKSASNFLKAYKSAGDNLLGVIRTLLDRGVQCVTFYAFSLKNFQRSERERKVIFAMIRELFPKVEALVDDYGVRACFGGRTELFPDDLRGSFQRLEERTRSRKDRMVVGLIGYDGKDDLERAVEKARGQGGTLLGNLSVPPEVPPVDLLIRTSGERRLSGFMPYRTSYAELYFSEKLWPDFGPDDAKEALAWYSSRERRFGK